MRQTGGKTGKSCSGLRGYSGQFLDGCFQWRSSSSAVHVLRLSSLRQRNCLPERFILLISTTGPTLRRPSRKQNSCLIVQAINGTRCMQDLAASDQTLSGTSKRFRCVSAQLGDALDDDPLLQNDKELRMFCLIVKGDIDTETNTGAMRQDWEQVTALARDLGDSKWQYRALAQLGMAAFYDADLETARKNIGTALAAATTSGDIGGQIRSLTIIAGGLLHAKMYEQSLTYIANANKIAGYHTQILAISLRRKKYVLRR